MCIYQRPPCPRCQTSTALVHVTSSSSGFDIRTFECPACDRVHQRVVHPIDPMISGNGKLAPGRIESANVKGALALDAGDKLPAARSWLGSRRRRSGALISVDTEGGWTDWRDLGEVVCGTDGKAWELAHHVR